MNKILDCIIRRDGFIDETEFMFDDIDNPTFIEMGLVKQRVCTILNNEETQEYNKLKGLEQINFVRKKILSIIN